MPRRKSAHGRNDGGKFYRALVGHKLPASNQPPKHDTLAASHATTELRRTLDPLANSGQFRQGKRRMKRAIAVVLAVVVAVDAQRPAPNRPTPALIQAGTNTTTAPTDDVRRPTNMPSLSPMTPFPTEAQPTYEPVSRIEFAGRQLRSKPVDRPRDWRQTTN